MSATRRPRAPLAALCGISALLFVGCGSETNGLGGDPDTGFADDALVDTSGSDSRVDGTPDGESDTGTDDTGADDTGADDTGAEDTGAADTGPDADTFVDDAADTSVDDAADTSVDDATDTSVDDAADTSVDDTGADTDESGDADSGDADAGDAETGITCTSPSECPGVDTECMTRTCTSGTCGVSFVASGTATATQTSGDCKRAVCDGAGNVTTENDDTDLPNDGKQCTFDVCTSGVPSHPLRAEGTGCSEGGGAVCNAAGACVACNTKDDCPGADSECSTRTCTAGVCGVSHVASGTATTTQTAGDCKTSVCDGAGGVTTQNDDTDLPSDDGKECTSEVCTSGVPSHPGKTSGTACTAGGGSVCDGAGACVECVAASDCPGVDTECAARTCTSGVCGQSFTASGTLVSAQTAGDCKKRVCDGEGSIVTQADDADLPVDGNECTSDVCTAGVPSNPAATAGTTCASSGGSKCDGAGACVQCNTASDCPAAPNACSTPTCTAGTCGVSFVVAGTPTPTQTAGDCKQDQCDGSGNVVAANDDSDVPVDGNQCTNDVCTSGVPSNTNLPLLSSCSEGGGSVCDGAGNCVAAPSVTATSPADATSAIASTTVSVTFSAAMDPASLTAQTTAGACTGSIQLSLDGFATCVALASASPTMSAGNTVATLTPAPGLLVDTRYQIRVTTGATTAAGVPIATAFTQGTGFLTGSPNLCDGSLVISQVYGAGGNTGAVWNQDFVELHNRGTTSVDLTGLSVQYASASGTSWSVATLSGSVPAGGYYLVGLKSGATGAALPTPDATATSIDMSGSNGKVALVSSTTALTGGCPTANVLDLVGYGTAACSEGGAAAGALSTTTTAVRVQNGCGDVNVNASDFVVTTTSTATPPKNGASTKSECACLVRKEGVDWCNLQWPLSTSATAGTTSTEIYGQLYQAGLTEPAGAPADVRAQVGVGPASANPQYQSSWSWTTATWNTQSVNNDEYRATFTVPAAGSWRYTYRFSLDQGVSWTYCDKAGAGKYGRLDFDDLGVLTSTP